MNISAENDNQKNWNIVEVRSDLDESILGRKKEILKEETEKEEDDYQESVNFWEMVEEENWKRFEGCFD